MRYPKFLPDEGTIGFVAPAFGCATEPYKSAFDNALKKFESMGYKCILGPNCYEDRGIGISNTPDLCGLEINGAYTSEESDVIISCGGGEMMCEVVPYINFENIGNVEPKWFMGFSDNTNFVFLSATLADTAAIYGPCAATFGMEVWHQAVQDAFDLLKGKISAVHNYDKWELEGIKDEEHPLAGYNCTEKMVPVVFDTKEDEFSGRLLGGCMDCLINLTGTKYDKVSEFCDRYKDDGIIWFLEACELNVMSIRRAIWHMKNAGWFKYVKGFLIGRPMCIGEEMFGIDHYRAVTDLLKEYQVPIIMDLDIGHMPPMMPLVCGAKANVMYKEDKVQIEYIWE